jgi:V/A-type H+-transporting ATPase subunit I
MAIDKMKKVTLLCPVTATQRLLKTIHSLSIIQLVDVFDRYEDAKGKLDRQETSTEDSDRELQKINLMLGLIDLFAPEKKSFVQGLAPVPLLVDPQELSRIRKQFPLDTYHAEADQLDADFRRAERSIGDTENRLKDLKPLEELPFRVADFRNPRHVRLFFGAIPRKNIDALAHDATLPKTVAWEEVEPAQFNRKDGSGHATQATVNRGEAAWLLAAALPDSEPALRKALTENGFEEIALPQVTGTVRDQVRALEGDLAELRNQVKGIEAKVQKLAEHRHALLLLKAFWEDCKKLTLSRANCAHGKWVQVVTGYVREKDVNRLEAALKTEYANVTVCVEDLSPEDTPPVSLTLPPMVRPIQMLVNLFGLPVYNSFDPSPFIMPTFLIFFGICFSDVAYGTMLIAMSLYIMHKTKPYAGIYNFARLLFYGGLSTVFFGFLLGSWFGDLYMPQYLGENNIMYRIMTTTRVIDPLQKPIVVLLIALTIGMFNQFYGIALKMYGALLRGDKAEALFDGLLWLVILPGFVLIVGKLFAPVPAPLFNLGLALFAVGAVGLILTQGRASSGLVGRFMTGMISLYGIVGTYGITAFIGDTMSYCRLLALALTTGIVALSFNMMADLLRPIPYVGIFLFIFVLVAAHVFNFFISVLGAFVHSMRLIFVEFFGRFYATGSKPFAPLGFDSKTAILRKQS